MRGRRGGWWCSLALAVPGAALRPDGASAQRRAAVRPPGPPHTRERRAAHSSRARKQLLDDLLRGRHRHFHLRRPGAAEDDEEEAEGPPRRRGQDRHADADARAPRLARKQQKAQAETPGRRRRALEAPPARTPPKKAHAEPAGPLHPGRLRVHGRLASHASKSGADARPATAVGYRTSERASSNGDRRRSARPTPTAQEATAIRSAAVPSSTPSPEPRYRAAARPGPPPRGTTTRRSRPRCRAPCPSRGCPPLASR